MENNKLEVQSQLSELIQQDLVNIITDYSKTSMLNLDLVVTLVQDINLLKTYDVKYIHNEELNELISLMKEELKNRSQARIIALLAVFDFIENPVEDFKKLIYINLSLKVSSEFFIESFNFFNVLAGSVKELFEDFVKYIFNDNFLDVDENLQIEVIFKIWGMSLQVYHDNEASQYAYGLLLKLFQQSLTFQKTEVAFWLYYTPLHYYKSGVCPDIDVSNEEFKNEVEKPLEAYILKYIIPKYNIQPNKRPINSGKKRVAFVMQRIIRHSTMNVFYTLVKALIQEKNDDFEFVLYDLNFSESGGSDQDFVQEFKSLGIEYVDVQQKVFGNMSKTYSLLEKCIKTREILINDEVDILIGLHTRVEYIFLYATRTAPIQIYWYHASNSKYDIQGIDGRITHSKIPNNEFDFSMFLLPSKKIKKLTLSEKEEIKEIRSQYPDNAFILGYIGRLIKIEDKEYLKCVSEIMKKNPQTIFLACGGGDQVKIKEIVADLGIAERFYFTGHINPHVYGYVIDYFLASFEGGGGESLGEFVLKRKPYLLKINEKLLSLQEINMHKESARLFGPKRVFALNKSDYIEVANTVINNENIREEVINFVVKEYIEQEFGSVINFYREVNYFSGKGFIELLIKFSKVKIEDIKKVNLPKLSEYKDTYLNKIASIEKLKDVEINDFVNELSEGKIEKRAYLNFILAEYFFNLKKLENAKVCIDRAWVLFNFTEEVLGLYIKINEALKDYKSIFKAYKRLGMEAEKKNNISRSLYFFNKAHYNYAFYNKEDNYEYDFDILDSINRMAEPYKKEKTSNSKNTKLRIAFLIYGFSHKNSSLVRSNLHWLESIDKSDKEVDIFVIDKKHSLNEDSIKNGSLILNMGHNIHVFPDENNDDKRLINIVDSIHKIDADILITGAALGKFEHTFITATNPARKIVGFLYGPPEQFCFPNMDEVITFSYFPAMDAPAKFVKFVSPTYVPCKIVKKDKEEFGIDPNNLIISSIGRYTKFQSKKFLEKIQEILINYKDVVYIFIGVLKKEIDFNFDKNVIDRIIFTGWVDNSEEYLSVTDILIDTYPSGGGLTILDAYNYKIPTIMFRNDFSKIFSQKHWSLEREYMNVEELVIKDINSNAFDELLLKLINSKELRREYGSKLNSYLNEKFIKEYIDFVNYKEILCVE